MNDQSTMVGNGAIPPMKTSSCNSGPGKDPIPGPDLGQPKGTVEPTPLAELDQLVTAERLRQIVWDEASRPSLQWVRKETKRRMLPHLRRGRLIFYRPRSVLEWYRQRESRPSSMK